jgi:cysteine-rich repeat protein
VDCPDDGDPCTTNSCDEEAEACVAVLVCTPTRTPTPVPTTTSTAPPVTPTPLPTPCPRDLPRNAADYLFLLEEKAVLKTGTVIQGNIGVQTLRGLLTVGRGAVLDSGTIAAADRTRLRGNGQLHDLFTNSLYYDPSLAIITGQVTSPVPPPVYFSEPLVLPDPFDPANYPPAFPITCGGPARFGEVGEGFTLPPGSYSRVILGREGTLTLGPGTYNFCELRAVRAAILVTGPVTINVRDRFSLGNESRLEGVGGVTANDIQINYAGRSTVKIGQNSVFRARLFAPDAALSIGRGALVTGQFIARSLKSDPGFFAPTCGDGRVGCGETCDPPGSATEPNGNLCRLTCTFCGDGVVQAGEQCDDGNASDGDGCRRDCTVGTVVPTFTGTPPRTPTATRTSTPTRTATRTPGTPTFTAVGPTATATGPTPTATVVFPTASTTVSATPTTPIQTGTGSMTPTATLTAAPPTVTGEQTPTATPAAPTPTATDVATAQPTPSESPTAALPTPTDTGFETPSSTKTAEGTVTAVATETPAATGTPEPTATATPVALCPTKIDFEGTAGSLGVLDAGFVGFAHDSQIVDEGKITVSILSCDSPSRPCGKCALAGPIENVNADNGDIHNRRCSGNTRTKCTANVDCAVAGGTCEFYFGTLLPLAAGGVSTCVSNQVNGSITGTANIEDGTAATNVQLISRVYSGPTLSHPCPRCVADTIANDNMRLGTCDSGLNSGQTCDVNGQSPNAHFGRTSLDCPPLGGGLIAALPIDLANTTGTVTRTLTTNHPNCRAAGFTGLKCFCDTCNNPNAEPCDANTDCPDGPDATGAPVIANVCGGPRCIGGPTSGAACSVPATGQCVGGANNGANCTVASACPGGFCAGATAVQCRRCVGGTNTGAQCNNASQCPGGTCPAAACNVPGEPTKPNACTDTNCDLSQGGNEFECSAGPFDQFCQPSATFRSCSSDGDCAGELSCSGGPNFGAECASDFDCPAGTCEPDLCTGGKNRECYPDNGLVGGVVTATGVADIPVNDESDPTLAAEFCIGPTSSGAVNAAAGIPGLGRIELPGHARALP